jgi:chromosome segregation ATPase
MSLDLYLYKKDVNIQEIKDSINILYEKKQAIQTEIEQLEDAYEDAKIGSFNITHNLNEMAKAAELYEVLWQPDKMGIASASQMIPLLEKGLKELEAKPAKYKTFNPSNGWGKYEDLVNFCYSTLQKCREFPDAVVEAWG